MKPLADSYKEIQLRTLGIKTKPHHSLHITIFFFLSNRFLAYTRALIETDHMIVSH